ncbi:hypothetical protein BD769DRAFT_1352243 [Suillus cothurnatus]|nr:hypothetical protein BD769DRAFT_1352243 [Suillus cothurnatus]
MELRRFAMRSWHFMDTYHRGLNRKQAAWAAKRYHGHHVLPDSILSELDAAKIL